MASGSGRGHGREGPRRSISMKGKGPMVDNLGHNDSTYHEYLQHRAYAEDLGLNCPTPPLIISESDPNDNTPNLTSHSENMSDIDTPPDFGFDTPEVDLEREEDLIQKQSKSDLFVKHMKKIRSEDGSITVACNYCNKVYKWSRSGGYGTYWKHIEAKHPEAVIRMRSQTQIPRYATPNQRLFRYNDEQNREELARMVAVEHLSFSFDGYYGKEGLNIEYDVEACCDRVKKLLYDLYEYVTFYGSGTPNVDVTRTKIASQPPSSSSGFMNLGYSMFSKKNKKPRCSSSSSDSHAELESYLASSCDFPEEFELLKYWSDATKYYPIMAMIAKNIFSTPVSTVAVEQEFSAEGNILDEKHSCLTPKALQIQVCVDG
ncbi:hypothetical protein LWI29_032652 [Acer saccharum]|uniref:HAT C-terminal dimerisation domain-containing protein n=1 Tax=Acer saccharum TaxID=4024 RepID=A0AA39S9Y0_ACESA|nr:hypothetical protein LWI29_032652 [Acer saccharum]